MPFYRLAVEHNLKEPVYLPDLIEIADVNPGSKVTLGMLENRKSAENIELAETGFAELDFSDGPFQVRAVGMISCAMVCFLRQGLADLRGFFYHANAGAVPPGIVQNARRFIAAPASGRGVTVVYAHPGRAGGGYATEVGQLQVALGAEAQVLEIVDLFAPDFGMNEKSEVGY
jgi:hypothetical protein